MTRDQCKPAAGRCTLAAAGVIVSFMLLSGCQTASPLDEPWPPTVSVAAPRAYKPVAVTARAPSASVAIAGHAVPRAAAEHGHREITLVDALDIALADNLDLALARAEQSIAQQRRRVSEATLYPALEAGVGASRTDGRTQSRSSGEIEDVEFNSYDPHVALVYRVNIPARIQAIMAERREVEAAALDTLSTRQRLMLRVGELYHSLLVTHIGIQISEQLLESSRELQRLSDALLRADVGHGADAARARARVAGVQQQVVESKRLYEQASARLATVLRLDPAVTLDPAEAQLSVWNVTPPAEDFDPVEATRNRPEVQAAAKRTAASQRRVEAARWSLLAPEIVARVEEAAIGAHADDLDDLLHYGAFIGWTLSLEKAAAVDQARAETLASRLRAARLRDVAVGEVRQAMLDIDAAVEQIPLAEQELSAAQEAMRLHTARFKAGTSVALEIIETQDLVSRAQLNVARAIEAYNLAQLHLLAAAGVLDRNHLVAE